MINEKRRLIDANELYLGKFPNAGMSDYKNGWNDALDAATTQAPPVDAVEVVRCFGCQHFDAVDEMEGGGYCNHPRFHIDNAEPPIVHAADFCSYGERKDDDD